MRGWRAVEGVEGGGVRRERDGGRRTRGRWWLLGKGWGRGEGEERWKCEVSFFFVG